MTYLWHDFVGNIGIALVLGTYMGLQMGKMSAQGFWYSALNTVGALLILVSLYFSFNLSSFIIEVAWIAISLYGLVRYFAAKKTP